MCINHAAIEGNLGKQHFRSGQLKTGLPVWLPLVDTLLILKNPHKSKKLLLFNAVLF